jgi:hypothetical protein
VRWALSVVCFRVCVTSIFCICICICISGNYIGGAGAASIAEALKLNTTITSVDLGCECRAGAGVLCARSFEVCVGRCRFSVNDIDVAGAASIAEALKSNTAITSVSLGSECHAGAGVLCAVV